MKQRTQWLAAACAGFTMLTGCAAPGPRYDNRGYYDRGYERSYERDRYVDDRRCRNCGEVVDIDRVYLRQGSSGAGAVIGAIIGGVLGSTVGKGDGRRAATVAGAVAGGFAGNAVERDANGRDAAWRFNVRLDDGRWAEVTQRDNPGVRRGDRVAIRNDRVVRIHY